MRLVDAEALRAALPMGSAIDALEEAFRLGDPGSGPLRSNVETASGSLLVMPATGVMGSGVKLVTLTPGNPARGLPLIAAAYVLFDPATQAVEAVLDGAALTALRTGAVSGLATRYLARKDASSLVIFGAGVQARSHLEAMRAVRPIERCVVVSRSATSAQAFAARAQGSGIDVEPGVPDDVAGADIVCTTTTSSTPLFEGALLRPGTHVNAVGTYTPEAREVDTDTVRRALVFVETRGVAMEEAGDLLIPIAEGAVGPEHVVGELTDLVCGRLEREVDDISLFKSVGMAFEDLVVARAVVDAT